MNGVEVHNLKHLKELVEGCTSSSLRFDLDEGRVVVLNFEKAKGASLKILRRHRIPSHASIDLLQEVSQSGDDELIRQTAVTDREHEKPEVPVSVPV